MIIRAASRAPLTTKAQTTFWWMTFWTREDARVILSSHSLPALAFLCFLLPAHKGVILFRGGSWAECGLDPPPVIGAPALGLWIFFSLHDFMMERIRKEMILMERGLHSPVAGKRLSNLSDSAGNAVLEALENSQHAGRLSPRITSASLHGGLGDIPSKGKFEIDSLFGNHHSDNTSSTEVSSSESRKKINLYPEVSPDSDMNSDVEVGCPSHRSPGSISQQKENNSKGKQPTWKLWFCAL